MLDTHQFNGKENGEHILILGAIHGDEICGTIAINKTIEKLVSGELTLQRGKVTFVPICNPKAHSQNTRYVERNLNRYMSPVDSPKVYEDYLTNLLCPLLRQADVLLDIHSYHVGGEPFIFIEHPDGEEVPYAKSLGVSHMVYGFQNAYINTDSIVSNKLSKEGMGTTEYMRQFGGYGITLECGYHTDPNSIDVAEQSIINTLKHFNMIDGKTQDNNPTKIIEIKEVHYNKKNAKFLKDWCNFQSIPKGTKIAKYSDEKIDIAEQDSYIVLPRKTAPIGEEWFYIGRKYNG